VTAKLYDLAAVGGGSFSYLGRGRGSFGPRRGVTFDISPAEPASLAAETSDVTRRQSAKLLTKGAPFGPIMVQAVGHSLRMAPSTASPWDVLERRLL
jgi:hypothetical protein